MEERLKGLALGAARLGLVGLALVLALGSLASSAARTFCPEVEDASSTVVVAAGAGAVLAAVVEDDTLVPVAPSEPDTPATAPTDEATSPTAPTEPGEEVVLDGSCAGGVRACAPPLLSSVLRYGDEACAEQAPGELRGRLVPPLLGAIASLGGAWALRPRHGEPVISRV